MGDLEVRQWTAAVGGSCCNEVAELAGIHPDAGEPLPRTSGEFLIKKRWKRIKSQVCFTFISPNLHQGDLKSTQYDTLDIYFQKLLNIKVLNHKSYFIIRL